MALPVWLLRLIEWLSPARTLSTVQGDALPKRLPRRDLVLLQDGGEDWCVGLQCPCGCGQRIELPLIREVSPHWRLCLENGKPTLMPSVWLREGCRAHFFLRRGKVEWV